MTVDSTSFMILLQPSLNIFEPLEIFFKVLLSGGCWIVIMLNGKKDKVIFIQFINIHGFLSANCDCDGV